MNLHNHSREVQWHQGMRGHKCIENAADLVQGWHVVAEPGDEPAECKKGRDATVVDVVLQLWVTLEATQSFIVIQFFHSVRSLHPGYTLAMQIL